MADVLNFEHLNQLEKLKSIVGSIQECKRLGYVHTDELGIDSLSTAGMAFLLYVVAAEVTTLAEAFAAGWLAANEECS